MNIGANMKIMDTDSPFSVIVCKPLISVGVTEFLLLHAFVLVYHQVVVVSFEHNASRMQQ